MARRVVDHQGPAAAAERPELVDLPVVHQPAVVDHDDAVADGLDVPQVVAGHENGGRGVLAEVAQDVADGLPREDVEADGRFVEQEKTRRVQQCAHELGPGAVAEGELTHGGAEVPPDVEAGDEMVVAASEEGRLDVVDPPQQLVGVPHREVPPEAGALGGEIPQLRGETTAFRVRVTAVHRDPAGGRREDPGDELHGGGLAGPVEPDVADRLALVHPQVDAPQRLHLAADPAKQPGEAAAGLGGPAHPVGAVHGLQLDSHGAAPVHASSAMRSIAATSAEVRANSPAVRFAVRWAGEAAFATAGTPCSRCQRSRI